jgi:hypothetical protein
MRKLDNSELAMIGRFGEDILEVPYFMVRTELGGPAPFVRDGNDLFWYDGRSALNSGCALYRRV